MAFKKVKQYDAVKTIFRNKNSHLVIIILHKNRVNNDLSKF